MRVLFAGTPAPAVPSLQALIDSAHEVVAVVTRPDAPAGRGRELLASPVRRHARSAGLEVLTPARPGDASFLDQIRILRPDVCAVVAYGALLPREALEVPAHGWVNLHFSILPAWRGAAPVQHAILAGDEVTGATTFLLEETLDTGPVFGVVTAAIGPRDTAGELLDRLANDGAGLLTRTVDGIGDGSLTPTPQPDVGVSFAPKIRTGDARVDWSAPALRVDRIVRACSPAPGAWSTLRGRRIRLGPVRVASDGATPLDPGQLRDLGADGVLVGTGGGCILLGDVQPEGKAWVAAAAWARGARLSDGDRFE